MRSTLAGLALSTLVAVAALLPTRSASADEQFDVSVAGGKVTVTTKGNWHINKEYPWKLTVGGTTLDKSKFTLDEKKADVSGAPKGEATLKGAVCQGGKEGGNCMPFTKNVVIN